MLVCASALYRVNYDLFWYLVQMLTALSILKYREDCFIGSRDINIFVAGSFPWFHKKLLEIQNLFSFYRLIRNWLFHDFHRIFLIILSWNLKNVILLIVYKGNPKQIKISLTLLSRHFQTKQYCTEWELLQQALLLLG